MKVIEPKIKGIHYKVHPEFDFIAEQYRKKLREKGISASQINVTKRIARELKIRNIKLKIGKI